ncbi:unnamed protein product [Phytophthora fragariaefolia]|uniref:Unnamed protein product n=1 Tax=Phytophthora fragariaefolia TaxID=1490495 RepID=A0A9W6Y6W4_9STRA|nr:unnamed protein product [Phytophthora fragariaefolia]
MSVEILAREFVAQRAAVIAGVAGPPERAGFVLPRAPRLPNDSDIVESAASSGEDGSLVNDAGSEPYSSEPPSTDDEAIIHDEENGGVHPDEAFKYDGEA